MNLRHALLPLTALALFPVAALADSGFYIGAAAGGATQDIELGGPPELDILGSTARRSANIEAAVGQ